MESSVKQPPNGQWLINPHEMKMRGMIVMRIEQGCNMTGRHRVMETRLELSAWRGEKWRWMVIFSHFHVSGLNYRQNNPTSVTSKESKIKEGETVKGKLKIALEEEDKINHYNCVSITV